MFHCVKIRERQSKILLDFFTARWSTYYTTRCLFHFLMHQLLFVLKFLHEQGISTIGDYRSVKPAFQNNTLFQISQFVLWAFPVQSFNLFVRIKCSVLQQISRGFNWFVSFFVYFRFPVCSWFWYPYDRKLSL